jgi:ribosome-associated heat shock protein Hsp15
MEGPADAGFAGPPHNEYASSMATVRIDRWLCATRLYKSRSLSQEACVGGLVKVNGNNVKPSHPLKTGDEVRAEAARGLVVWLVKGLAEKRLSAELAAELYDDKSPPPPPREETLAPRERGAGRPTKAERRALDRLREEF